MTVRPHYLRAWGNDLEAVMALAAHDLVVTRVMTADEATAALQYPVDLSLRQLDDDWRPSAGTMVVDALEDLQQDLIEGVGSRPGIVVWPRCPMHDNHPLWLRINGNSYPAWTCPTTQEALAELGDL